VSRRLARRRNGKADCGPAKRNGGREFERQRSEERVVFGRAFAGQRPLPTRPAGTELSRQRKLQNLAPKTLKSLALLSTLHVGSKPTRSASALRSKEGALSARTFAGSRRIQSDPSECEFSKRRKLQSCVTPKVGVTRTGSE